MRNAPVSPCLQLRLFPLSPASRANNYFGLGDPMLRTLMLRTLSRLLPKGDEAPGFMLACATRTDEA